MSAPQGSSAVAKAVDKIYLLINSQMILEQKQAKIEANVCIVSRLCTWLPHAMNDTTCCNWTSALADVDGVRHECRGRVMAQRQSG